MPGGFAGRVPNNIAMPVVKSSWSRSLSSHDLLEKTRMATCGNCGKYIDCEQWYRYGICEDCRLEPNYYDEEYLDDFDR